MRESLYQFVMEKLQESKGTWASIAIATDMSYRTLEKIARGEIADPGVSHIEKLADYFRDKPKRALRPAVN